MPEPEKKSVKDETPPPQSVAEPDKDTVPVPAAPTVTQDEYHGVGGCYYIDSDGCRRRVGAA